MYNTMGCRSQGECYLSMYKALGLDMIRNFLRGPDERTKGKTSVVLVQSRLAKANQGLSQRLKRAEGEVSGDLTLLLGYQS